MDRMFFLPLACVFTLCMTHLKVVCAFLSLSLSLAIFISCFCIALYWFCNFNLASSHPTFLSLSFFPFFCTDTVSTVHIKMAGNSSQSRSRVQARLHTSVQAACLPATDGFCVSGLESITQSQGQTHIENTDQNQKSLMSPSVSSMADKRTDRRDKILARLSRPVTLFSVVGV